MDCVALEPVINDPLLTRLPLAHQALFHPYGFAVKLQSNSPLPIEAADVSWSTYRRKYDARPLDVRMLISESASSACIAAPIFRSQGHLLSIVADAENFACLDLNEGFSFGWATKATALRTEYFRQCLLDVMIYPLLEVRHLVTVHAACLMFDGKGILFAGDSGAGKSSLAYACARRGWTYVSDDASAFLRAATTPRIIGHPQKFRFREPVSQLFPEFGGLKSTIRTYGKPTIEVRTQSLKNMKIADESPIHAIVFLNRRDHEGGPPRVLRVSKESAWKRFSFSVWAVQLPAFEQRLRALERLLQVPLYELRYDTLDPAIDLLESIAVGESFETSGTVCA
jgi:hypothetical protein